MRHRAARFGVLAAAAAVLGGCGGALFACENADECAGAGAGARCEADGWCSVDDESCPSGHRYGEHSGDGKAGACVDEAGTSSDGTTLDPTTATTLDPSTVTTPNPTLDPTTSSTDPTVATLESTSASDTDATTSSETTLDPTTEGPKPSCGDGVVDADEDCEDGAPLAVDCKSLGWASGEVSCNGCSYDTSACEGCGPDGCSFEPCAMDDPNACEAGESCADLVNGGLCTGDCEGDDDCSHPRYDTLCYMSQAVMGICLVSCEEGPCPDGMTCVPVNPAVCVFA